MATPTQVGTWLTPLWEAQASSQPVGYLTRHLLSCQTPTNTQPPSYTFSCGLLGCTAWPNSSPSELPLNAPVGTIISLTSNNGQTTRYLHTSGLSLWGVGSLVPCCMLEAPVASALSNPSGLCISLASGGRLSILQEPGPVFKEEWIRDHWQDGKKSWEQLGKQNAS